MLRIKSAQYLNMPAKPMTDPLMTQCRLCEEPKQDEELSDGFCRECLYSGLVHSCVNCRTKGTESEMETTQDKWLCQDCAQDLYGGPRRQYTGPRRDYYSGPAELY